MTNFQKFKQREIEYLQKRIEELKKISLDDFIELDRIFGCSFCIHCNLCGGLDDLDRCKDGIKQFMLRGVR